MFFKKSEFYFSFSIQNRILIKNNNFDSKNSEHGVLGFIFCCSFWINFYCCKKFLRTKPDFSKIKMVNQIYVCRPIWSGAHQTFFQIALKCMKTRLHSTMYIWHTLLFVSWYFQIFTIKYKLFKVHAHQKFLSCVHLGEGVNK